MSFSFTAPYGSRLDTARFTTWPTSTDVRRVWDANAWEDCLWWRQSQDRGVLKRINLLVLDVMRHGNEGLGKPEPLKHDFAGYWSRRITDQHRLVYKVLDDEVRIARRYHYGR